MKMSMVFIALTMTTQSLAQVKFGVRAGLNIANVTLGDIGDAKQVLNTSYHFGGIVEHSLTNNFSIESGLQLSGKGTKIEQTESLGGFPMTLTSSLAPLYLEVPINAKYNLDLGSAKLHVFAGPYFGIGIGGKMKYEATYTGMPTEKETIDIKFGSDGNSDDLKRTDFGLNIGAGIEIKNILIRAQYGLGLTDISPNSSANDDNDRNRVIGISIGYMFGGN